MALGLIWDRVLYDLGCFWLQVTSKSDSNWLTDENSRGRAGHKRSVIRVLVMFLSLSGGLCAPAFSAGSPLGRKMVL